MGRQPFAAGSPPGRQVYLSLHRPRLLRAFGAGSQLDNRRRRKQTGNPLLPLRPNRHPESIAKGTTVYADKGYDSEENRQHLKEHQLLDGIMRKACRNRPLAEAQTKRNRYLSKTRYVVEQSFGTLHRKFRYARAAYFGLIKVSAQSHLKAMCLNLLKAAPSQAHNSASGCNAARFLRHNTGSAI